MRCLWLARMIPLPLNDGAGIYSANMAAGLARAGVDVTFLGLETLSDLSPLASEIQWRPISGTPRSALVGVLSRDPLVAARFALPAYRAAIKEALAEAWDMVVIDHYAMVWALPLLSDAHAPDDKRPVMIHIAHNFETEVSAAIVRDFRGAPTRRAALWLNARRIAAAERRLAQASDILVALTAEDAASLTALAAGTQTTVCPPGYDAIDERERDVGQAERKICMIGSYHWVAKQMNLEAFLRAADGRLADAGVALDVIGDAPADFIARIDKGLRATRFLGFVPDLAAATNDYRFGLIVEETGGGFKLKVLDYIFRRLPVAALDGSFRGVPAAVSDNFLIASNASALADAILAHIDDIEDLNRRQSTAFSAARGLYDWNTNGRRLRAAAEALSA